MTESRYYDRAGVPIDMKRWGQLQRDVAYCRVDLDEIGGASVSTVWLGLNHEYGDGPPLIFETMIFGGPHDEAQWRHSTEEEARAGHQRAVAIARSSFT